MNECLVLEGKKVGKQASGNMECAPTSPACGYLWGLSNIIPLWRELQTSAFCSSKNPIPQSSSSAPENISHSHKCSQVSSEYHFSSSLPNPSLLPPPTPLPGPRSCRFARPGLSFPAAWEPLGGLLRSEKVQAASLSTACNSRLWFGPGGGAI